jgi:exocyst complex component 1
LVPNVASYVSEGAGSSVTASSSKSRTISPTPSSRSRKQAPRGTTNGPEAPPARRDHNARVSFFDTANQGAFDRLISGSSADAGIDGEDESAQATMANVEEMLEGYEWATDDVIGRKTARGAADLIEARLLDELVALEKVKYFSSLFHPLIYFIRQISILSLSRTTE